MTLWVVARGDPVGCAITHISQNRYRVCELFVVAGEDVREWTHLEAEIVRYAKEMSCDLIEGYGRKGWQRMVEGYKPVYMTYRKEL